MDGSGTSMLTWFVVMFFFIFLYPRLMLAQLIYKLEQSAAKMESMSRAAERLIRKRIGKKDKKISEKIRNYMEFFIVSPSDLDPYGIVKRIDTVMRQMEDKFKFFTNELVGNKSQKLKQQINYGLRAGMSVHQIAKIVRHNVEMIKKFKNLQLAIILQMQLPLIEKIAKSELLGTESFVNAWPVGDSIGPLVASSFMNKSKDIAEDIVMDEVVIEGRTCFVLKAKGPGPRLGRIDEAIKKIIKKHKISRIITIDAASKLEGEKSGTVAEGVGFAMGGLHQRELIENIVLPRRIPLDSVVIKVGSEEAIEPMKLTIFKALPKAQKLVKEIVKRSVKGSKIIIVGVGNSSGTPNTKRGIKDVEKLVKRVRQIVKKREKPKKQGILPLEASNNALKSLLCLNN